jgi:hypothetical protein
MTQRDLSPTILLIILLILAACGPAAPAATPTAEPLPTSMPPATSIEELQQALSQAGVSVRLGGRIEGPGTASGWELDVGSERVRVFSTKDPGERQAIVDALSAEASGHEPGRLWSSSGLLVVYEGSDGGTRLLLSGLLGDPMSPPEGSQDEPYPPAVLAAIARVSAESEVDPGGVAVSTFAPASWQDDCLGLPAAGEACQGGKVDGWRVVLDAGGRSYEVHTDATGGVVRIR